MLHCFVKRDLCVFCAACKQNCVFSLAVCFPHGSVGAAFRSSIRTFGGTLRGHFVVSQPSGPNRLKYRDPNKLLYEIMLQPGNK